MSCTLFAFMGFSFLMPLLCACLSLICNIFATQQKVDNVGLAPTNNCLPFFPFIAYSYKVS